MMMNYDNGLWIIQAGCAPVMKVKKACPRSLRTKMQTGSPAQNEVFKWFLIGWRALNVPSAKYWSPIVERLPAGLSEHVRNWG
jgi:hypothetical protein